MAHAYSRANERYDVYIWIAASELRVGTKNSHSSGFYGDLCVIGGQQIYLRQGGLSIFEPKPL